MYGMWGAALPEAIGLRPAYLALWEIMSDAVGTVLLTSIWDAVQQVRTPQISKGSGAANRPGVPVNQSVKMAQHANNSVTNQVQSDQRFQLFMQLWPKLPLSVTRRLGTEAPPARAIRLRVKCSVSIIHNTPLLSPSPSSILAWVLALVALPAISAAWPAGLAFLASDRAWLPAG